MSSPGRTPGGRRGERPAPGSARPAGPGAFSHGRALRAGGASFVGTTVEFYDFYVYATAAALVFPQLFFPTEGPVMALIASLGTYAVGFFARPLGGIVFGHIGDRYGRRVSLVATLLLMGIATTAVGLLPTYAGAGIIAPIGLVALRILQGLAVGGEWGGAVVLAVEHAPERFKGFYGAFPQVGNPMGALLASGIFAVLTHGGTGFVLAGGWRIPFLLSAVLIAVGLWVRSRIDETPVFAAQRADGEVLAKGEGVPLVEALRTDWAAMLTAVGMLAVTGGGYYLATTFATSYATGEIGGAKVGASDFLTVMSIASLVELLSTLPVGWLADRWGRKRVMTLSLVLYAVTAVPMFLVLDSGSLTLIAVVFCLNRLALNGTWAPVAVIMAQMFGARTRQSSVSLSYSTASALWSGLSPVAATALYGLTHSAWSVIGLMAGMSALSIVCLALVPQVRDRPGAGRTAPAAGAAET